LLEGFEQQPDCISLDTRPGVLHQDHQQRPILFDRFRPYTQPDFTRLGELYGIAEQIDQHLAQLLLISDNVPRNMVEPLHDEAQIPVFRSLLEYRRKVAKLGGSLKTKNHARFQYICQTNCSADA
jgi:hypothetical protein